MSTEEKRKRVNKLGHQAEYYAFLEASKRGADVYPNFLQVGKADCVMKIHGELYEFDVKCDTYDTRRDCWIPKHTYSVKPPVWPICVTPDNENGWVVRWPMKHGCHKSSQSFQCPQGLEGFWN